MEKNAKNNFNQSCEVCYKIICRGCGWEAGKEDAILIQKEELTSCPLCGWAPGDAIL